jgi:CubicO group peptidase (beta-lactamase class C family)
MKYPRSTIFTGLVALFVLAGFVAAASKTVDPGRALKGLDVFIQKMLAEWKVPGAAVAVVTKDSIVLARGYGWRDVEAKLPATADTLFAIGSCSKAFTTTGLAILADEDRLDWDAPVRSYLPSFKLHDPVVSERMIVRDLVSHRSGLPRHDMVWYSSKFGRQELFDRLQYLEPSRDLRQLYQYNNLMFMAAGCLVEKLAGQAWEEFIARRILEPLGMSHTNFSVEEMSQAKDFARPYAEFKGQVVRIPFHNLAGIGPAGSINSSAADMALWLQLNLNKGKSGTKRIVSEPELNRLQSPQMVISQPLRYDELFYGAYGLGWNINSYRGNLLEAHSGSIDGFEARVALLPRKGFGLAVLANLSDSPLPAIISYQICDRLLGLEPVDWNSRFRQEQTRAREKKEAAKIEEEKARRPGNQPSHRLEEYAGFFIHPGYGTIVIHRDSQSLKGRLNEIPFLLTHYHYDIFRALNEALDFGYLISFRTGLKGDIESLAVELEPTVEAIIFNRAPSDRLKQIDFIKKLTGSYAFSGIVGKVVLRTTTLFFIIPGKPEYELEPYQGLEFKMKNIAGFTIEFVLDPSDKDKVVELISRQPDGVFRFGRQD